MFSVSTAVPGDPRVYLRLVSADRSPKIVSAIKSGRELFHELKYFEFFLFTKKPKLPEEMWEGGRSGRSGKSGRVGPSSTMFSREMQS